MITPAIRSCPCLFDRCLSSSKLYSSVILGSFGQMEAKPTQTKDRLADTSIAKFKALVLNFFYFTGQRLLALIVEAGSKDATGRK